MACVKGCPGAIPHVKEGKTVEIRIEDKTYRWGDVDMGKCTLMFHGGDPRVSPFIPKSLPGYRLRGEPAGVFQEQAAYKICWTSPRKQQGANRGVSVGFCRRGARLSAEMGRRRQAMPWRVRAGACGPAPTISNVVAAWARSSTAATFIKRPRWLLDVEGKIPDDGDR